MVAILAVVFLSADDEHKHKRNNIERSRPASALSTLAMRSSIGGELALPLLCERKGRLHWMKTPGRAVDRPLEVFRRSRPHRRPMASSALPPSPPPPPPKFITIEHSERLARYIYAYTELLYRWGLLEQRTDIMRYVVTADNGGTGDTLLSASGPHYLTVCHTCGAQLLSDVCTKCQKFGMRCVICHQPARGRWW